MMTTFLAILFIITFQCVLAFLLMCGGSYIGEHGVRPSDITLSIFLMAIISGLTILAWSVGRL